MSSTIMLIAPKCGPVSAIADFRNAHRFHPAIWNALADKYLLAEVDPLGMARLMEQEMQPLWDLGETDRMSRDDWLVLRSTADHVVIEREFCCDMADVYRRFAKRKTRDGVPLSEFTHLLDVAAVMDAAGSVGAAAALLAVEVDPDSTVVDPTELADDEILGVCFTASHSEYLWQDSERNPYRTDAAEPLHWMLFADRVRHEAAHATA